MGRVKPKNLYPIKDLAAANAAMAEIAGIKRSIANIESTMNESIDRESPLIHYSINGNQACNQQKELKKKVDLLISQEGLHLAIQ